MFTSSNNDENEIKIKPAITSLECEKMLNEAVDYLAERSLAQAQIMHDTFYKISRLLERQPGIGTKYINGMRRIMLGKFRYQIYYIEQKDHIDIVGIWHTSRGTEFEDR
ncbi:MAG: type II toxin-antitoxin system RelE/ParE family toxin [Fibromonadaceae bacterium]|jgi:plasmid stabilization system protein ParE|nr:type II toxin-antitoxin system RelE/ParE family toxin [Fibromonadaceae bacterium]